MSLQTPLTTGAVRDCCVEGRRRVTHRAEAARGWFFLSVCLTVKPVGEPDALIGHVRFDERGWETERWPQAPSNRAHSRLYRNRNRGVGICIGATSVQKILKNRGSCSDHVVRVSTGN